ncbi:hypothetical protein L9F63_026390, partial [Diploptera punctata]
FKSVDFVIWNHAERRTWLRIPCGGGHRSWDLILNQHTLSFTFLKDKMVHMVSCRLDKIIKPVMQRGFHTKQIMCIREIPFSEDCNKWHFVVSASEDTTVRIAAVDNSKTLQPLVVLQSHISSVRCIAVCAMKDGPLVFTGGGRAQLKVWRFMIEKYP